MQICDDIELLYLLGYCTNIDMFRCVNRLLRSLSLRVVHTLSMCTSLAYPHQQLLLSWIFLLFASHTLKNLFLMCNSASFLHADTITVIPRAGCVLVDMKSSFVSEWQRDAMQKSRNQTKRYKLRQHLSFDIRASCIPLHCCVVSMPPKKCHARYLCLMHPFGQIETLPKYFFTTCTLDQFMSSWFKYIDGVLGRD